MWCRGSYGRRRRRKAAGRSAPLVRRLVVRVEDCLRRRVAGHEGPVIAAARDDDAGGMELAPGSTDSLRFPDDRSDSGVSSLRGGGSAGSGDERSGSRSSALSSGGDDVWRDPGLLSAEPSVRHVHSVQHSSLLMAHPPPAAPGNTAPAPQPPSHYVGPLLPPPPTLYQDMLWKPRYPPLPGHALLQQDLLVERDRMIRERQELEKQRSERERQEREKLERERQEREKLERDRQEREKQMERERQERERIEKQRATEQAVHKHFEESLRLLQQKNNIQRNNMCWNLNTMPMASRGAPSSAEEDQRKRVEQRLCSEQQMIMAGERLMRESRDRAAFYPQQAVQQRVASAPKPEYHPPPAHSRVGGSAKTGEKQTLQPTTLPKAEPNFSMFGYQPYQSMGFISQHDAAKMKGAAQCKEPPTSLPNPPPLMSDVKNSVIVKNDGKMSHMEVSQVKTAPPPHSPSPKLQTHYVPPSTQARQGYEYRSPSQSPHHLSQRHTPSPLHHRTQVQQPQPHRQSPDQRYRTYGTPAKPATMASYPYPTLVTTGAHYIPVPGVNVAPGSKPKVSSPAPPHIYGMPTAGISTGVPVCRPDVTIGAPMPLPLTSKAPLASSVSPSPYQQLSHGHQPPHPSQQPSIGGLPPPAHSKGSYDNRLYSPGLKPHPNLPPQQGSSPPAAAAQHASPRSSPMHITVHPTIYHQSHSSHSSMDQLQPLDLGVSANREETSSPKRKTLTPQHSPQSVLDISKKRPRLDTSSAQLARVSEPSPLVLGAATTITTVVNTAVVVSQPQDSPIAVSGSPVPRTCSGDGSVRPSSTGSSSGIAVLPVSLTPPQHNSPAPSPNPPGTPGKATLVDSDKSNSPGPPVTKPSSYQVHKLKKAWLQRHSGEDGSEDTTGVVGSGSCVTLPLTLAPTPVVINRENSVVGSGISNLLQNVGTMAMSSICKPKTSSGSKGSGRKGQTGKEGGPTFNGHGSDISGKMQQSDSSSSSDQERESKTPPKRKPPKVKRKKGTNALRKAAAEELKRKKLTTSVNLSESASDSDKESGSEKDTDSGGSAKKSSSTTGSGNGPSYSGVKEPRKRGRRPKSKNERGEEPRQKKPREDPSAPQRDPFRKPPISQLKKTGETFLQDGPCFEVAPKLGKCRECRWTPNQRSKNMPNIFCRFYAFRRLRYTKNGQLAIAGFSEPHRDASEDDLKLWLPRANSKPSDLDLYVSHFVLAQVGDQFCHVVQQEKECLAVHMSDDRTIAWKRVVQGVREMCDVCETTLFNYHWACGKCGFVVCIDCYKSRKTGTNKCPGDTSRDKDDFAWLLCTNSQPHEQEKLMLTQIIAGDSLMQVGRRLHEVRVALGISQFCGCRLGDEPLLKGSNGICKELWKNVKSELPNGMVIKTESKDGDDDVTTNSGVTNGTSGRPDTKGEVKPEIKCEVKSEMDAEVKCEVKSEIKCEFKPEDKDNNSPLSWLADVALLNEEDKKPFEEVIASGDSDLEPDKDGKYSTLRKLLIRPSHKHNGSSSRATSPAKQKKPRNVQLEVTSGPADTQESKTAQLPGHLEKDPPQLGIKKIMELRQFIRRFRGYNRNIPLRPRIMTLTESTKLYPGVPHSWLCNGWLLRLHDPNHVGNYGIFQDQWRRGQPVLVSDVAKRLDKSLWTPESFARDFGDEKNDLVNCSTGAIVTNQPMRRFWEGFDHTVRRLKDDRGNPMVLKLKDWPTGEDFAEMLPARFNDLMKALPLTEYTHRTGRLNLASRLPECFVRPDLGPKMYNAYGMAHTQNTSKGTTNLHLDISDAVNVMVYVGITKDAIQEDFVKDAFQAIEESCCDIFTKKRVQEENEVPGALWHIYSAQDADKIRNLLNQVSLERGVRLEAHHDPIHDQSWYLDKKLRDRLYVEYGVQSHSIVQCLGDSIFIPAGAPHQVRNLHNCIKVAEDFVSPENVSHCFHMTQEFRCLSNTHTNHEDKLQIKNIIYHAVKDSLSVISSAIAMAKEEYVNVTDSMESGAVSTTASEQLTTSNGDVKEDSS